MKFLLVLLLACRAAAEQDVLGYGGDLGIKNDGSGDDATGMVIDGYAETGIEGQSGENGVDVVKGGDDGVDGFGGDARGHVEGEASDEGGEVTGAIEVENGGSGDSLTAAVKGGNTGAEGEGEDVKRLAKGDDGVDATDIVQSGKDNSEGDGGDVAGAIEGENGGFTAAVKGGNAGAEGEGEDAKGSKKGDDGVDATDIVQSGKDNSEGDDVTGNVGGADGSAPSAENLGNDETGDRDSEPKIAVDIGDGEAGNPVENVEGIAQGGEDVGSGRKVVSGSDVGGSTANGVKDGDAGSRNDSGRAEESKISGDEFDYTKGRPYGGHYFDGTFVHKYDHPCGKVEFGVLGGLLHDNPLDYFGVEDYFDIVSYRTMDNYTHELTAKTGERYRSKLIQTADVRDFAFKFLVRNFGYVNLNEVLEIVRHRIHINHDFIMLIAYLESDEFTWHRFQLKKEPSVEAFLKHHENLVEKPYRGIFYKHLRVLIRRLFSSCPARPLSKERYQEMVVNFLMSNMALTEVAEAMQEAITKKSRFNDYKETFDVLKRRSTIRKLRAIRASPTYNKMRIFLAEKVFDLATLEKILKVFFGFDLALIFSVYTILF